MVPAPEQVKADGPRFDEVRSVHELAMRLAHELALRSAHELAQAHGLAHELAQAHELPHGLARKVAHGPRSTHERLNASGLRLAHEAHGARLGHERRPWP
jgi:hypothetical protein